MKRSRIGERLTKWAEKNPNRILALIIAWTILVVVVTAVATKLL